MSRDRGEELVDVIVLGGGIAGLAAADELIRHGVRPSVIERETELGGLLRTDRIQGFSFDRGGHRIITAHRWILSRIQELLGERLLLRQRRSLILLDGKQLEYPLRARDLVRNLGPLQNVRALLSYLAAARHRCTGLAERHLEGWLRARFGDFLYRKVFEGYSEKLWGCHPRELSADWAAERISIPSLGHYLLELLRPSDPPPRTYAREYLYPRTGIGEIPEALARRVREAGGEVATGCRPRRIERDGSGWRVEITHTGGGEDEGEPWRALRAEAVISTIPIPALMRALRHSARPPVPDLRTRGLTFVDLGFSRPIPLDATWLYHPDPSCPFTRIQVPAARSPEMVPAGCGSIQLEIPTERYRSLGREAAMAAVHRLLVPLGADSKESTLAAVRHEPDAYPLGSLGARARAKQMLEWLDGLPGLHCCGRQGRFEYCFLDRALAGGVNAARAVLGLSALDSEARNQRGQLVEAGSIIGGEETSIHAEEQTS